MSNYIYYSKELYHHGVKGQKWGTRQYQNEDGSLTALGRQHYGYGSAREAAKKVGKAIGNVTKKYIKKKLDDVYTDAMIAQDKSRRQRDPIYDRKRQQEEEREKWRREHDPIYRLKKDSQEAFKSEKEVERQNYKEREKKKINKDFKKEAEKLISEAYQKNAKELDKLYFKDWEKYSDYEYKMRKEASKQAVNNIVKKYGDKNVEDFLTGDNWVIVNKNKK